MSRLRFILILFGIIITGIICFGIVFIIGVFMQIEGLFEPMVSDSCGTLIALLDNAGYFDNLDVFAFNISFSDCIVWYY